MRRTPTWTRGLRIWRGRRGRGRRQRCADLAQRAEQSGHDGDRRFLALELAGSWRISQLTAARWVDDAERFHAALPGTLALLEQGELYCHQAGTLLHRTRHCPVAVARAVEAELLPDVVGLCLIVCGGSFDSSTEHYRDNIVVFAHLVRAT